MSLRAKRGNLQIFSDCRRRTAKGERLPAVHRPGPLLFPVFENLCQSVPSVACHSWFCLRDLGVSVVNNSTTRLRGSSRSSVVSSQLIDGGTTKPRGKFQVGRVRFQARKVTAEGWTCETKPKGGSRRAVVSSPFGRLIVQNEANFRHAGQVAPGARGTNKANFRHEAEREIGVPGSRTCGTKPIRRSGLGASRWTVPTSEETPRGVTTSAVPRQTKPISVAGCARANLLQERSCGEWDWQERVGKQSQFPAGLAELCPLGQICETKPNGGSR